jgi:hypothetical protein
MDAYEVKFIDRLSIFESPSPWYYVEIPTREAENIRREFRHLHRGWGSIPVIAQIGDTTWKTSIFWEKKGNYLLFVKKEIRNKEKITTGDKISVRIQILYK